MSSTLSRSISCLYEATETLDYSQFQLLLSLFSANETAVSSACMLRSMHSEWTGSKGARQSGSDTPFCVDAFKPGRLSTLLHVLYYAWHMHRNIKTYGPRLRLHTLTSSS